MFLNVEKAEIGVGLNDLKEELHLLEVGTFEIEDFVDLGQSPADNVVIQSNCTSCSRYCSCSQTCQ
ncbi:MAG TPA: hypothetical protein VKR06_26370 [Ktedonosporobacter sp.]|nr:hypothetical protein [Ktedonosporobacter sp.]